MKKILTTVAALTSLAFIGACSPAVDTQEATSTTPITAVQQEDSIRTQVQEFKTSRDAVRPKAKPGPSTHELHVSHLAKHPKVKLVRKAIKPKTVKPKVVKHKVHKIIHKVIKKTKKTIYKVRKAPGGIAACIRKYESGGNYRAQNPGNTASGAYQFVDGTWHAITGLPGHAKDYPPSVQDAAFYKLWNGGRGAGQWTTAGKCGY